VDVNADMVVNVVALVIVVALVNGNAPWRDRS
jgi:hypothetical protein